MLMPMMMNRMMVVTWTVSSTLSTNDDHDSRRVTLPISADPAAPMAAPSVGEKKPRKMPPITNANSTMTPHTEPRLRIRSDHDARAARGPYSGLNHIQTAMAAIYRADAIRPGTTPAANNLPIEVSVRMA